MLLILTANRVAMMPPVLVPQMMSNISSGLVLPVIDTIYHEYVNILLTEATVPF
jgi:hypothetical protein